MDKFLKVIGFLILALALWQSASSTFIDASINDEDSMSDNASIAYHHLDASCITSPQLPVLPDAELAGLTMQSQLLTFLRVQRSISTQCMVSLKSWIDMLALRQAVLSLHRKKLYDTTPFCRYYPACEYYVFTLKRILI